MSEQESAIPEESTPSPPVVDLLKRHATMPSRQLILSEAFELARRLRSSGASSADASDGVDSVES